MPPTSHLLREPFQQPLNISIAHVFLPRFFRWASYCDLQQMVGEK